MKNNQLPYVKQKGISVTEYRDGTTSLLPWVKIVEKGYPFGRNIIKYNIMKFNDNTYALTDLDIFSTSFSNKSNIELEEILDECIRKYFSYKDSTTIVNKYEVAL